MLNMSRILLIMFLFLVSPMSFAEILDDDFVKENIESWKAEL